MVDYVAARIADADEIRRSRQFPYQYLAAYLNARQRRAAEDQGGAAPGGRDRLRQRAGAAGSGRHRSGRVGLDELAGHGPPWPRRNDARCAASTWRRCSRRPSCAATRTAWSFRSTRRRTTRSVDPQRLDPEPGGAAGQVRRRRNRLLAAAARGQHALTASASSPAACWSATTRAGSTAAVRATARTARPA